MIQITPALQIAEDEVVLTAMTAQGAGGQNVNKVSSAIHLRFDIRGSSLPEELKTRLLEHRDRRITRDGEIIIKAQRFRQQEKNRADALERLAELIRSTLVVRAPRKTTRPTRASRERRLEHKTQRSQVKSLRRKVDH